MLTQTRWHSLITVAAVSAGLTLPAQAQQLSDQQSGQTQTSRPVVVPRGPHSWPEMPLEQRIERARQLVAAFTQRPIANELQFVEEQWTFRPYARCVLRLPATGEVFEVWEREDGCVSWRFAQSAPPVEVLPSEYETFARAFCARFLPEVPSDQLVQFEPHRWAQLIDSRVVFTARQCLFSRDTKDGPYSECASFTAAVRIDPAPRIDAEEAKRRAVAYIAGWPGIRSAELSDRRPTVPDQRAADAARLGADQLGVQRLVYYCCVRIQPTDPSQYEEYSPYGIFVLVDAVTGVCTVPVLVCPRSSKPSDVHLTCSLTKPQGDNAWLAMVYEPRLIDGRVYFCGQYLDSYLWGGSYAFDRESGSFTAVFRDHTWQGKVGERQLLVDGVAETYPAAPLRIEEEAYLPAEMLERITGWQVRHTPLGINQAGNVELVHPAVAAAEREEKRP